MKPRTKLQKEVAQLSHELPELTLKQRILLRQHIFKRLNVCSYFYAKGLAKCTSCGHIWHITSDEVGLKTTCPCCKNNLDIIARKRTSSVKYVMEYATISQAFKGWQVTRTFVIKAVTRLNERTDYYYDCIQECWDSVRGRVLLQCTKSMYWNYAREGAGWIYDLSIKNNIYYTQLPSKIDIVESVSPELRKHGYNKRVKHDFYLQPLFKNLLSNNFFESYWKRKLYDLAGRWMDIRWGKDVDRAITIFLRHNKQGWKNTDEMNDWLDMVECLKFLNKDILSPAYICPKDIAEAHQRWLNLKRRKQDEVARKERHDRAVEKAKNELKIREMYLENRRRFNDLLIHNNDIFIKVLPDIQAFIEEGDEMMHCVFENEYYNLKKHPNSLILSARLGESWQERLETIEVSLSSYTIVQSRGYKNSTSKRHDEIIELVNNNMDMIRKYSQIAS